jgi:putative nucleotidyltransferase with HDIG domain
VGPAGEVDDENHLMDDVVRGLAQTPPPPTVLLQVLSELDNRGGSAKSLASIVSSEPVLAASLLRAANSAATGLVRRIMSVDEAVAYLGHSTIRGLMLRMQLAKLLPSDGKGGYDSDQLWKHSLAVGQVAAHLARRLGDVDTGLVSTIGVLHDIGKLAMNSLFPAAVAQLFAGGGPSDESFLARERRLFGGDHAFVGSMLASQWKLPPELVDAIRYHHCPSDASLASMPVELRRATRLVHVANQLVKYSHVYCADMEIDIIPERLLTDLGLPPQLESLLDRDLQAVIQRSVAMCGAVNATK